MKKQYKTDIAIIGGGMVGLSLGIALAQAGLEVAVIEKDAMEAQTAPAFDGRVSALSLGTKRVLSAIGVWPHMAAHAEAIMDIRVADAGYPAYVHYHYSDAGDEPVGHMVENRHTRLALLARAAELPSLRLFAPTQLRHVARESGKVEVTLEGGEVIHASLLAAADGRRSGMRAQAGIGTVEKSYRQSAIVCTIEHELPHEGLAVQRFLPHGPFAALPMQYNRSAIVWSEAEALVPSIMALPEEAFIEEIAERLGTHLGRFKTVGKRFSYPLHLILAKRYTDERLVLVGDAAHAIHPVAGQGVNVGFRDVAVLTELITDAARLGLDIGSQNLLAHYQRWRRFDAVSMAGITDGVIRLFSNDIVPLRLARDAGLNLVNGIPSLKRLFMRHAMGLMGDLPKMMRAS